jgi:hypothetical protein
MKALITLLILGTSSVALARPIRIDHRDDVITNDNITVRDHRDQYAPPPAPDQFAQPAPDRLYYRGDSERPDYGSDYNQPLRFRLRPITLANDVSFMRQCNRDSRPLMIDVDARVGGLKKLRIDRAEGRMYVDSVVIHYADGHHQTLEINQVLSARQPSVMINLDHGALAAVEINGQTMRGRATFDVIGIRR